MKTVYLVIADDDIRNAFCIFLESFDVPVQEFSDADGLLGSIDETTQGCLIVEAELPGLNGLALLTRLRANVSKNPIVLLVDAVMPGFARRAMQAGAAAVLEKPLTNDGLVAELRRLCGLEYPGLAEAHTQVRILPDDTRITIRAMQPSDRHIEQEFVRQLSPQTRYWRFFGTIRELSEPMLDGFTHIRFPNNIAFIAVVCSNEVEEEIGVARYAMTAGHCAEFAVVVADVWQGRGIGRLLLRRLVRCAKTAGVERIEGTVMRQNRGMLTLARALGFHSYVDPQDAGLVRLSGSSSTLEADIADK